MSVHMVCGLRDHPEQLLVALLQEAVNLKKIRSLVGFWVPMWSEEIDQTCTNTFMNIVTLKGHHVHIVREWM